MQPNPNSAAFPVAGSAIDPGQPGLSCRDYFAVRILEALIASIPHTMAGNKKTHETLRRELSLQAVEWADAFIATLNKG